MGGCTTPTIRLGQYGIASENAANCVPKIIFIFSGFFT
jgi:hypothetical protein